MLTAQTLRFSAALAITTILTGCASSVYAPRVANRTTDIISAKLYRTDNAGRNLLLMKEPHIGPGADITLGRFNSDNAWTFFLEVDSQPSPGEPAQVTLQPGTRTITVRQDGGRFKLEESAGK